MTLNPPRMPARSRSLGLTARATARGSAVAVLGAALLLAGCSNAPSSSFTPEPGSTVSMGPDLGAVVAELDLSGGGQAPVQLEASYQVPEKLQPYTMHSSCQPTHSGSTSLDVTVKSHEDAGNPMSPRTYRVPCDGREHLQALGNLPGPITVVPGTPAVPITGRVVVAQR